LREKAGPVDGVRNGVRATTADLVPVNTESTPAVC